MGLTITIHQPEHLPWLGFFDKIRRADLVVLLDNVVYKKQYFENRSRIRVPDGMRWITVPVLTGGRSGQFISDVEIDNSHKWWQHANWRTIEQNYRGSPYWASYGDALRDIYCRKWHRLADLNVTLITWLSASLGIKSPFVLASSLPATGTGTERLVSLCQATGATDYISGPFGRDYLDAGQFDGAGIRLQFHEFRHPTYGQMFEPFMPGMSALDLLFNDAPSALQILEAANS